MTCNIEALCPKLSVADIWMVCVPTWVELVSQEKVLDEISLLVMVDGENESLTWYCGLVNPDACMTKVSVCPAVSVVLGKIDWALKLALCTTICCWML